MALDKDHIDAKKKEGTDLRSDHLMGSDQDQMRSDQVPENREVILTLTRCESESYRAIHFAYLAS